MALRRVELSTDVYFVCLNHSMCTEGEEMVGLLVGEVDEERVAHIVAVLILRRSDKRKDRVEISPEQLSNAPAEADKLSCILKRPVRVLGWYHSHPKLHVHPSSVDCGTQESYQLMDEGFIGMIFSVFNADPNKNGGRIQMICFQSTRVLIEGNSEKTHFEIPIKLVRSSYISNACMNSIVQLPRFLCQEEQIAYQMANQVPLDFLTKLHNSSVYLRKMGLIAEVICGPLLKMLEERILNNEMKRKRLQERKKYLTAEIERVRKEKAQKKQGIGEKARLKELQKKEHAQMKEKEIQEEELLEKSEQEIRETIMFKEDMDEDVVLAVLRDRQIKNREFVEKTIHSIVEKHEQAILEEQKMKKLQLKDQCMQVKHCIKDLEMQVEYNIEEKNTLGTYQIKDEEMQGNQNDEMRGNKDDDMQDNHDDEMQGNLYIDDEGMEDENDVQIKEEKEN